MSVFISFARVVIVLIAVMAALNSAAETKPKDDAAAESVAVPVTVDALALVTDTDEFVLSSDAFNNP